MNVDINVLYVIIALGTISGGIYAIVNYLASIKRKVDTDEFNKFMSEQRMAWQEIKYQLATIENQLNNKINSEELTAMKFSIIKLTEEIESLKKK